MSHSKGIYKVKDEPLPETGEAKPLDIEGKSTSSVSS
jgi:hypothetical protein